MLRRMRAIVNRDETSLDECGNSILVDLDLPEWRGERGGGRRGDAAHRKVMWRAEQEYPFKAARGCNRRESASRDGAGIDIARMRGDHAAEPWLAEGLGFGKQGVDRGREVRWTSRIEASGHGGGPDFRAFPEEHRSC